LPLGRRVKLTQVRPSTGYVETAAPMPVGTAIGIASEDGVMLEAIVAEVHEQVAGSDKPAGMIVRPKLDADTHKTWWKQRVALPDVVKSEPAPAVGIVRSRRKSENAVPELMDDGRNTGVMEVANAAEDKATVPDNVIAARREMPTVPDHPVRTTDKGIHAQPDTEVVDMPPIRDSNPNIVDDGKRTIAMSSVDLEALGLSSSSGSMPAVTGDDDSESNGNGDDKPGETRPGSSGRRKKKRR
jgi:hypothetical protein